MKFEKLFFAAIALSSGACLFGAQNSPAQDEAASVPQPAEEKISANGEKSLATPAIGADSAASETSASAGAEKEPAVEATSSGRKTVALNVPKKRRDLPWVSPERKKQFEKDAYLLALRQGRVPEEPTPQAPEKEFLGGDVKAAETPSGQPAPSEDEKKMSARRQSVVSKFSSSSSPELSADKFDYAEGDESKLIASGNAKVSDKNFELNSEKIVYSQSDGTALASGDVQVSIPEVRMVSESLFVDMSNEAVSAENMRFGTPPAYVGAGALGGDRKKFEIKDPVIEFGSPSWANLNATASSASYDLETEYLELEDVTFRMGAVPFFYTPYYAQHGLKKPPFNYQNRLGYNSDYGFLISNTLFYNGLGDFDPGVLLDYYTKRSVLIGPALNYDYSGANTWLKGLMQGAYINDHGNESVRGLDSLGRQIGSDRFFVDVKHAQMFFDDRVGLVANVNYWSDEFMTRDFRPTLFYDNQQPDNFAELNYYGDFFTGSVFARFAPNNWQSLQQRLPEVRVDMHPVQIFKTGVYQTGFASYSMLRSSDASAFGADYFNSNRVEAFYGITRPFHLNSWSTFTPVIGGRASYYANAYGDSSDYMRFLGQIGFDAQMDVYGSFDFKSETLRIDGLRHRMTPIVSYRYMPKAEQGRGRIPQVDRFYYGNTYAPILDLGSMRNTDEIYSMNTLRFGVQNVLETRDEEYGSREIARLDIYQDINFDRQPIYNTQELQSFSDLYINASVSPSRWLRVGVYNRISVNRIDLAETNAYIQFMEGDEFSLYLISSYLQNAITQYSAIAEYKITEDYRILGRWAYDYRLSKLTDQTYSLWTRISNSYIIEYQIGYRDGSSRQNDFSFGVRFTIDIN